MKASEIFSDIMIAHGRWLRRCVVVAVMAIMARNGRLLSLAGLMMATTLAVGLTARPLAAGPGHSGYKFSVVATLGDAAPGGGDHEGDFEPQDINASGSTTFVSDLEDENGFAGEGLFLRRGGVNSLIARSGQSAPGTSTTYGFFGALSPSGLNDAGNAAFGFTLNVPFTEFGTNAGVWRYTGASGAVTPVLLPGQPAPGGTTFRGSLFHTDINNRNEIATVGIIDTPNGNCTDPIASCFGLGRGVYKFDKHNRATKVAAPGDPAPGSTSTLDDAWDPNLNDRGDVVFGGHVKGEPCLGPGNGPSSIGCYESLYLYRASTGSVTSLVHQGDAKPGGGTFVLAFNGRLNNVGDVSFIGGVGSDRTGVFLRDHDGSITAVAAPGDSLPGGTMANTTFNQGAHAINNAGAVAFVAQLDADTNGDSVQDTGVYLYDAGAIRTVVRTGTVIPGLGTVVHVNNPFFVGGAYPWPGVHLNERGQVLTQVIMDTGLTHVVVATPD